MNAQMNLFKDVKLLTLSENSVDPTININDESVVVYIDDEEDYSDNPMHVKIEPDHNYEDESNQSMIVEPDDQIVGKEVSVKEKSDEEIFQILPVKSDLKLLSELSNAPIVHEEQFKLLNDEGEEIDTIENVTGIGSASFTKEQSFEFSASTLNDHSYHQSNQNLRSSYCHDIVKDVLSQANLVGNPNVLSCLKSIITYVQLHTPNEDKDSQVNLFLQNIIGTLNNEIETVYKIQEDNIDPVIENNCLDIMEDCAKGKCEQIIEQGNQNIQANVMSQESIELFTGESYLEDEIFNEQLKHLQKSIVNQNEIVKENQDVKSEIDFIIKTEPEVIINNNITKEHEEIQGNMARKMELDVNKLKNFITNASNLGTKITNTFKELYDLKYKNEEDIVNGKTKLSKSLQSAIKESCKLLMEIENVEDKNEAKLVDFIEKEMFGISKRRNESIKKESLIEEFMDIDADSEETENEEINKLCNINKLKTSKSDRVRNKDENYTTPTSLIKNKMKQIEKIKSYESDFSISDDSDNVSSYESEDENVANSSDEEKKMVEKHESKCKNMLLVSSDDEGDSDDFTYTTSESSLNLSINDKAEKEKKQLENKVKIIKKKNDSDSEKVETPITSYTKKKKQNDSTNSEIFKKSFLDLGESDDKTKINPLHPPTTGKTPINSEKTKDVLQTEAVDLTQFSTRQTEVKNMDLRKYIEKLNEKASNEPSSTITAKPTVNNVDDDDCYIISSDSDSEVSSTVAEGKISRRRKELSEDELKEETKKARKAEKDRIKKLEEKNKSLSQYLTQRLSQTSDDEVICEDDLILDYSKKHNLTISVHAKLAHHLKSHQKEGVKFMYDNCYGNIDDVKEINGSGCILAHCMGLGKTLQLITLIHTVIRFEGLHTKKILVICPKSTIYNWYDEFKRWLSPIKENDVNKRLKAYYLQDNLRINEKIDKLEEWHKSKSPGVFLINYEAFRILVNWSGSHKRAKKNAISEGDVKIYQDKIKKYLLQPGANLVVCDEGHSIKNQKGETNKAISKVACKRRIILTGTPIQNNLGEYYAMVHWIKPCYLGDIREFNNVYANPIKEGQNKDSTYGQIKKMKQKCFVLNKMLDKFVQRKEASVLKEFLPEKHEYCLFVMNTEIQTKLYKEFLSKNPFDLTGKQLLPDYTALRKIWTHPQVLQYAYERALKGNNKFTKEQIQKIKTKSKNVIPEEDEDDIPDDIHDTSQGITAVTSNWWESIASEQELKSIYSSNKLMILFELLKKAHEFGEKVLIFSAFVAVLDVIEKFMKEIHTNGPKSMLYGFDQYKTTWEFGKDYFKLDGSTPRDVRHEMIQTFNKEGNSRLRCFLISAKAGGQGINLTAANRCVLIDTSWNPASDQQNIFRIYRLGQQKPCYIYRLVALGTMEEKIYSRSVNKQAMSGRVVDRQTIDRHYRGGELKDLYTFTEYSLSQREIPSMPQDDILKFILKRYNEQIFKYHEHDSLLENKPEQDLSEEEKREAWETYENEQKIIANRQMANNSILSGIYAQQYPEYMNPANNMFGSVTGIDLNNALSKSYLYPLTSNIYNYELYKKLQQTYSDPISSLYATVSQPTSSSTTSSSYATSSSSSAISAGLMSLIRPSLAPPLLPPLLPPSSLSTSTSSSSLVLTNNNYNANSIPPSSKSIFAKASLLSSTPSLILQNKALPTSLASIQASKSNITRKTEAKDDSYRSIQKEMSLFNENKYRQQEQMRLKANRKNNSPHLSHLPDDGSQIVTAANSICTSSRITLPNYPTNKNNKYTDNMAITNKSDAFRKLSNSTTNSTSTIPSTSSSSARTNSPYVRKIQTSSSATIASSSKTKMQDMGLINRPPQTLSISKNTHNKMTNFAIAIKNSDRNTCEKMLNTPNNKSVNRDISMKTRNNSVANAIPRIQKQLEKNQTSMTDATTGNLPSVNSQKSVSVIGELENSVSIIKLPTISTFASSSSSSVIRQTSSLAISQVNQQQRQNGNKKVIINDGPTTVSTSNSLPAGMKNVINRNSSTVYTVKNNKIVITPQQLHQIQNLSQLQTPTQSTTTQGTKRPANIVLKSSLPTKKSKIHQSIAVAQVPLVIHPTTTTSQPNRSIQQQRNQHYKNLMPQEIVEIE